MNKEIEQRISTLEESKKMFERVLSEEKMQNSPRRPVIEQEIKKADEEIEMLKSMNDDEAENYIAEQEKLKDQTMYEDKFMVNFSFGKIPSGSVSCVFVDENKGEMLIQFTETKNFFARKFFLEEGRKIKDEKVQIVLFDMAGIPSIALNIDNVRFKEVENKFFVGRESHSPSFTSVYFSFPKKKVKYASAAR